MIERAPEVINISTLGRREVAVTSGGLRNGYISLAGIYEFFPAAAIGGARKTLVASQLLTIISEEHAFRSDIVGGRKWMIRNRSRTGMRGFLVRTKARVGDIVVIHQIAEYVYFLRLERRPST